MKKYTYYVTVSADDKEKAEDKTYENEETPSEPKPDKPKGDESENYDWEEEIKYELPSLFGL